MKYIKICFLIKERILNSPSRSGCAEGSWRSCLALMLVIYSGEARVPPPINKLNQIMVRSRSPYQWRPGSNVLKKNLVRLAEVWLDEFKEIYYERINNKLGDLGDLSQRKLLRNNLRCKRLQQSWWENERKYRLDNCSFSWYLENIFPELFVPTRALHQGSLRSAVSSLCLTIPRGRKKELINKAVSVQPCKHFANPRWNIQTWHYSSG